MKKTVLLIIATLLLSPMSAGAVSDNSKSAETTKVWKEPATGMEFVFIKGGCFMMGQQETERKFLVMSVSDENYTKFYADELPRHEVCVSDFWMGKHEVTQAQWLKIMETNPAHFRENLQNPVDMVSWEDSQAFIGKLNRKLKDAGEKKYVLRLPTEAEWEYAARAGTSTMFSTGDEITTDQANFNGAYEFGLSPKGEYRKGPMPVGSFSPNPFGLYDMHGNVWEWCNDWYGHDYYAESPRQDPPGPNHGDDRVMRGCSWCRFAGNVRSATRYKHDPRGQYADSGLRLVRVEAGRRLSTEKGSGETFTFDSDF